MGLIQFFFTVLLPMSATGAAAVLVLAATGGLLHRFGKTRWGLWPLLASLCLFILPLTALRLPSLSRAAPPVESEKVYGTVPRYAAVQPAPAPTVPPKTAVEPEERNAPVFSPVLLRALPALYLAGVLAAAAGTAASYVPFRKRLRRESRPASPRLQSQFARARQATGLKRPVALYETDALHSPMAVGLLRPSIYLPAGTADAETLDCALYHECTHLRRGHIAYKLLAQAVCALHWFNPAAWLLRRMIGEACEFDCDRAVTRWMDGAGRRRYCAALLSVAEGGRALTLASAFARPAQTLRKRMEVILMPKQNRAKQILSLALCAVLLLSVVGLTACAAQDAAEDAGTALQNALPQSSSATDFSDKTQPSAPDSQSASSAPPEESTPDSTAGEPVPAAPDAQTEYVWPVPEYTYLTRVFSTGGTEGGSAAHTGLDICAPAGTDIVAVQGGVVEDVSFDYTWGNNVKISHGNGMFSRYAHCEDIFVGEGDAVQAGQLIAHVGNTGNSTGSHCHLEIEQDGYYVDPQSFFGMKDAAPEKLPVQQATETGYVWPVPVYRGVTCVFEEGGHRGIDIAAQRGADIVAVCDGRVTESGTHFSYGKYILLDHGDGTSSRYAHCEDLSVEAGDTVTAGQVIAHTGSTGATTGIVCHLEILQGDVYIDPETFFDIEQIPATFIPGMGCNDPYCLDASHHHDCPAGCTDYSHHHTCPLDCTDASHHHGASSGSFIAGMGCSNPYCTDTSHHHDCPASCTDYSHHHTCPLDCTDVSHHHGGTVSTVSNITGHHGEYGHHGHH